MLYEKNAARLDLWHTKLRLERPPQTSTGPPIGKKVDRTSQMETFLIPEERGSRRYVLCRPLQYLQEKCSFLQILFKIDISNISLGSCIVCALFPLESQNKG